MLESRTTWGSPHADFLDKENRIEEVRLAGKVKHRILGFYGETRGEFVVLGTCIHRQKVYTPHNIKETVVARKTEIQKNPGRPSPVLDRNDLAKFSRKSYRDGYLQSKVRGMIAYQIQALRERTGLNQTDFATKIGKTQSVVSRLEDTEYGRVTVQTLLDIACALDVALVVKFVSYPDFLFHTRDASTNALQPDTIQHSLTKANAIHDAAPSGAAYKHFLESQSGQRRAGAASVIANDNANRETQCAATAIYARPAASFPLANQAGAA